VHKTRGEAAPQGRRRRKSSDGYWRRVCALAVAGTTLVGLFAVAGYQVGNIAVARVAPVVADLEGAAKPAPALRKASLIAATPGFEPEAAAPPAAERPIKASLVAAKSEFLIDDSRVGERGDRLMRLVSPPVERLENARRTVREQRRRIAEHKCLSRAIYFEARSESEIGRLAVARVILNRVNSPFYPDSICEVVYQNAHKTNACQFSFACDGASDRPRRGKAWVQAQTLATRALSGDGEVKAIATATHYHADYVQPKWSDAMTRLVKIGRHIFYSGS
jgi:spore germination cell wall hydrolase CwlJ-like protein